MNTIRLFLLSFAFVLFACNSSRNVAPKDEQNAEDMPVISHNSKVIGTNSNIASPRVIVYRTKKDYKENLPVILDETKTKIISYPDPIDVRNNARPIELENGYLLDNRGIGPNVAFTSYTYSEYSALKNVPSREELLSKIIDKDPLLEMWACAPRHTYSNLISDINNLIKEGFPSCTSLINKYINQE